jgi:hypothetical protein
MREGGDSGVINECNMSGYMSSLLFFSSIYSAPPFFSQGESAPYFVFLILFYLVSTGGN